MLDEFSAVPSSIVPESWDVVEDVSGEAETDHHHVMESARLPRRQPHREVHEQRLQ